jgi:hypothetical protein
MRRVWGWGQQASYIRKFMNGDTQKKKCLVLGGDVTLLCSRLSFV